jgi:hypothetical protein
MQHRINATRRRHKNATKGISQKETKETKTGVMSPGMRSFRERHGLLCVVASLRLCVELLTSLNGWDQGGLDSGDAGGAAFWEIVFPNLDDSPGVFSQHSVDLPVPELIRPSLI